MGKAIPAARKAMAGVYGPPGPLAELVRPVAPRPPAASAARPGGTSNRPGPPLSGGSSPVHPMGTRGPPRVPSQRPIARASPPNPAERRKPVLGGTQKSVRWPLDRVST